MNTFERILNSALDWLCEPFEGEKETKAGAGPKPNGASDSLVMQRLTNEIITGHTEVLERLINRYRSGKKEDLVDLFKGNRVLGEWILFSADTDLILKLPKEIRELIDDSLT